MKIFYTNMNKRYEMIRNGNLLIKVSLLLFVIWMGARFVSRGNRNNQVGFWASMLFLIITFLILGAGLHFSRKILLDSEDFRVYVYQGQRLYMINCDDARKANFSAFKVALVQQKPPLDILIAGLCVYDVGEEKKASIKENKDMAEIQELIESTPEMAVEDIEIESDDGRVIEAVIRTLDNRRKPVRIGSDYTDHKALFTIVREKGRAS